jgi:hypothetical protein
VLHLKNLTKGLGIHLNGCKIKMASKKLCFRIFTLLSKPQFHLNFINLICIRSVFLVSNFRKRNSEIKNDKLVQDVVNFEYGHPKLNLFENLQKPVSSECTDSRYTNFFQVGGNFQDDVIGGSIFHNSPEVGTMGSQNSSMFLVIFHKIYSQIFLRHKTLK